MASVVGLEGTEPRDMAPLGCRDRFGRGALSEWLVPSSRRFMPLNSEAMLCCLPDDEGETVDLVGVVMYENCCDEEAEGESCKD